MIRHIVWWDLKPEAEGRLAVENGKRMKNGATAMLSKIPSLKGIEVSYTIHPGTSVPVGIILQSTHDDAAGLNAYATHPVHLEYVKLVEAVAENIKVIDYEL